MDRDTEKLFNKIPSITGFSNYDPVVGIQLVNRLLPLKKEGVLDVIEKLARANDPEDGSSTMLLLRMLFEVPQNPGYLPAMFVGAISPENAADKRRLPQYPIFVYEDIPILTIARVMQAGTMSPLQAHIDYYRKFCTLRAFPLKPPRNARSLLPKIKAVLPWNVSTPRERFYAESCEYVIARQLQRVQSFY